ncbi:50S ribosomal protein L10 [bacterium]|nr:MAG: 50S ribosomal protein L10 [bacterium]
MKKIGLVIKETSEKQIKENLSSSRGIFIIKYSGVSSPDLCSLRQSLKQISAKLFVVKNSVARRALEGSGLEALLKAVEGPCGMVFAKDDAVNTSKVLFNFTKEHEKLKLEAGFLEDKILEAKDIERLAKLPTQYALRTQLVFTLKSPISGLVMTLKQALRKIVVCLDQIKNKKTS